MVGTGAAAAKTVGCCLPAVKSLTQDPFIQLHSDVSLEYVSLYKLITSNQNRLLKLTSFITPRKLSLQLC